MEQRFVIRCSHCRWARRTTGLKDDLQDLHEVKSGCSKCGSSRKFKCPQCGRQARMLKAKPK